MTTCTCGNNTSATETSVLPLPGTGTLICIREAAVSAHKNACVSSALSSPAAPQSRTLTGDNFPHVFGHVAEAGARLETFSLGKNIMITSSIRGDFPIKNSSEYSAWL